MDKEQAREKFRLADKLFNEHQFGPALKVLTELNSAFPNERHILYPMARCLAGLGRNGEAVDLADRIVRQFDYPPATELYKRLKSMKTGDGLAALESGSDPGLMLRVPSLDSDPVVDLPPGVPTLDSDPVLPPPGMPKFDSDPPPLPKELDSLVSRPFGAQSGGPPPAVQTSSRGALIFWIALGIVVPLAYLGTLMSSVPKIRHFQVVAQEATQREEDIPADEVPWAAVGSLLLMAVATTYILGCIAGYWSLRVAEALPSGDFGDSMKDIALYTLFCFMLWCVLLIGWIFIPIILAKHYSLSFGKTILVVLLWIAFDTLLWLPLYIAAQVAVGPAGA